MASIRTARVIAVVSALPPARSDTAQVNGPAFTAFAAFNGGERNGAVAFTPL